MPKILVVEDEEDIAAVLIRFFTRCGHEMITAACVRDAVARAQEHRPKLILMDMYLESGGSGLEATTLIRADKGLEKTPIIALSANARPEAIAEMMQAGCNAFLSKPVSLAQLKVKVDQLLAGETSS